MSCLLSGQKSLRLLIEGIAVRNGAACAVKGSFLNLNASRISINCQLTYNTYRSGLTSDAGFVQLQRGSSLAREGP